MYKIFIRVSELKKRDWWDTYSSRNNIDWEIMEDLINHDKLVSFTPADFKSLGVNSIDFFTDINPLQRIEGHVFNDSLKRVTAKSVKYGENIIVVLDEIEEVKIEV